MSMKGSGVSLIRLECGNANAIDGRVLETIGQGLDKALSDKALAVVITGYENHFSAGLNLTALPETREGMAEFVEAFERCLLQLLRYPLPAVAAVNGHAVAGGLVLACACDLRIGAEGRYRIGLSEVDVGVPFPSAALEIVRAVVAKPWTTDVILGSRLLDPAEAVQAGFLHGVVPAQRLEREALARARELGSKPQPAFRLTKAALHAETLSRIEAQAAESRKNFIECWLSDDARQRREGMLKR
ncbi:MAG: enoyl-CoA hydratase/isomerase family protein [Acidobacteriota bacterium]